MNNQGKRVMAVDFGDARTGVAVSDASAAITGDAWVISEKRPLVLVETIVSEAKERDVGVIVVGYPKNMDGTVGPRALLCETLAENIKIFFEECCEIEVVLWDERMTTMMAERLLIESGKRRDKRKKTVDAVAASLILENYLNANRQ